MTYSPEARGTATAGQPRVAYHFTMPPPADPSLDAALQDILWLQHHVKGDLHYLYPAATYRPWIPPWLAGIGRGDELRQIDETVDLHHLFSVGLHSYPFLRHLRRPTVCTLVTTLGPHQRRLRLENRFVRRWVTSNEPDAERLRDLAVGPVAVVPPGIDLDRFHHLPPPNAEPLVLLAGSAPWNRRQFRTKGTDLLLAAAQRLPWLRLVLLWRGVLSHEIRQRVAAHGLASRVEIIDEKVDVTAVLQRVHAAVVLAEGPTLVKAYPHSLLEALAAGRPVVASDSLAIADLVQREGCGETVARLDLDRLIAALERLVARFHETARRASSLDLAPFSRATMLASYRDIYEELLAEVGGGG